MTANVQKGAEEGNVVSMRHKAYAPNARHERSWHAPRGRVLRSVLRPVHVNPHYASRVKAHEGGASESASRLGKLGQPRRTNTGVGTNGRSAARHASPSSQGEGRDALKKRKEIKVSVPARIKSRIRFGCPHVEVQLQKSVGDDWSRISSANALQKERQGRVNRGLARSEGWRVKPSASASSERKS